MTRIQRRTLLISIVGVLAVLAYAVLAALQILVLNPLAAAPGLTMDEIRFAMAEAGRTSARVPCSPFSASVWRWPSRWPSSRSSGVRIPWFLR